MSRKLAAVVGCAVSIFCAAGSGEARIPVPCDLILKYGVRSQKPPGTFHLDLVFANSPGGTSCRLSGFPEAELIGQSVYRLPHPAGRSQAVTLRPGEDAHAVLTWLRPSRGTDRWIPIYLRALVRTNRGSSTVLVLRWRYGPVLRQRGPSLGPIRPGAH